jgi:TRAP-type C4-dicarboxylate transport system substrate-binding protein
MKRAMLIALAASAAGPLAAEELAVVGSWSGLPLHKEYEAPFWTETLPRETGGALTATLTTHDQMGIQGSDVYRMLGQGVFDVGMTVADYAVADAPELEGLDVPMIAMEAAKARETVEAAKPMVEDIYADAFNAKALAIAPYPPQVVFCNAPIESLADLEGKKVRASGRMTAKLLDALGAEGVTIGFGEVPGALQRGVVDCAVTGAGSGYNAGWWEVSTHLLPIPLGGWDPVVVAMNMDAWNGLSTEEQDQLASLLESEFEAPAWAAAQDALETDIACLTGEGGGCPAGPARDMSLVEASQADMERARAALLDEVLPDWADRAGEDWARRWNESVGRVAGVQIPLE